MNILIKESQYSLILESMNLVSSFDDSISNLSKIVHVPYGKFRLGTEGKPWFIFLIFDKQNRKELLRRIKDWKSYNDVDIFLSDEASLSNNNHRHGLSMYKQMKDFVNYNKISSVFDNPTSIAVFITPKKEIVDAKDKVFYHSSIIPNLEKVGLKPNNLNMKYKNRLYFWDSLDIAKAYGDNISREDYYVYEVNLNGYDVAKDPEERGNAYFIELPVNAERVKLVGKFEKFNYDKWWEEEKKNR